MKKDNKNIGNYGEDLVSNFLKNNKHKILHRNFRKSNGEIDIISLFNNIIIFTEVKTRFSKEYGLPFESVTKNKQKNIKKLASYYIYFYKLKNYYVRFDVAEVYLNNFDNSYKINIIEDAFR